MKKLDEKSKEKIAMFKTVVLGFLLAFLLIGVPTAYSAYRNAHPSDGYSTNDEPDTSTTPSSSSSSSTGTPQQKGSASKPTNTTNNTTSPSTNSSTPNTSSTSPAPQVVCDESKKAFELSALNYGLNQSLRAYQTSAGNNQRAYESGSITSEARDAGNANLLAQKNSRDADLNRGYVIALAEIHCTP